MSNLTGLPSHPVYAYLCHCISCHITRHCRKCMTQDTRACITSGYTRTVCVPTAAPLAETKWWWKIYIFSWATTSSCRFFLSRAAFSACKAAGSGPEPLIHIPCKHDPTTSNLGARFQLPWWPKLFEMLACFPSRSCHSWWTVLCGFVIFMAFLSCLPSFDTLPLQIT